MKDQLRLTAISPAGEQWTLTNAELDPMAMTQWSVDNHLPATIICKLLIEIMISHDAPSPGKTLTAKGQGWTVQVTNTL
jgi:hypothetical protein